MVSSFIIQILYQLHKLNLEYNFNYNNLTVDDILISDLMHDRDNIVNQYEFNFLNKITIHYREFNGIALYGHMAHISNLYKSNIKYLEYVISNGDKISSTLYNNVSSFLNSTQKCCKDIHVPLLKILCDFVDKNIGSENIIDDILNSNILEQFTDIYYETLNLYKINRMLQHDNIFVKNIKELYYRVLGDEFVKNVKNVILKYKFGYIDIPSNTKFITCTKLHVSYLDETNLGKTAFLEEKWYYNKISTLWFVSNYELDESIVKYVQHKKINGCLADAYCGNDPFNMGRHIVFESTKKIKFLLTTFDLETRIKFHYDIVKLLFKNSISNSELKLFLENNKIKEDTIVSFIFELLLQNKKIDFEGWIGMDFINISNLSINGETTTEYVIFDPKKELKLIGVYHYNYLDSKYRFFMNKDVYNMFFYKNFKEYKKIYGKFSSKKKEICIKQHTASAMQNKCENIVYSIDTLNDTNIATKYIQNMYTLLDHISNIIKMDFWTIKYLNKVIEFNNDGTYKIVNMFP